LGETTDSDVWKFRRKVVISNMAGKHTETEAIVALGRRRGTAPTAVDIDANIARASTPAVYSDPPTTISEDAVFARSWRWQAIAIVSKRRVRASSPRSSRGCLDGPPPRQTNPPGCAFISNVHPSRHAVVEGEGHLRQLRCATTRRRFNVDGSFVSCEFEATSSFKAADDNLPRLPLSLGLSILPASIQLFRSGMDRAVEARVGLDASQFRRRYEIVRDYRSANWALYRQLPREIHIPLCIGDCRHNWTVARTTRGTFPAAAYRWGLQAR
jgi:hypothetical protein